MAREPRNNMKDSSFFHIIVQGINKEYIFDTRENKEEYLKLIHENKENIEIIAYCIMGNHAHILIQTKSIYDIENWMRKANIKYAMHYNKKNKRVGYVFKNRYKSQPIKNIKHFYLCVNYIHNNPVKAMICVAKEEYEFSSYNAMYKANQNEINKKITQILQNESFIENQKEDDGKFEFMEEEKESKEDTCNKIINNFLKMEQIEFENLKIKSEKLAKIVKILKNDYNISYRTMEKCLGISREKLRKLVTK